LSLTGDNEVIGHSGQVRMTHACQDGSFLAKLPAAFFGGEEIFFYCRKNAQTRVFGFINCPYAPFAIISRIW